MTSTEVFFFPLNGALTCHHFTVQVDKSSLLFFLISLARSIKIYLKLKAKYHWHVIERSKRLKILLPFNSIKNLFWIENWFFIESDPEKTESNHEIYSPTTERVTVTHQICDNSKIGNFDLVKNSFAAEPGTQKTRVQMIKSIHFLHKSCLECVRQFPTRYEADEVWLDSFELVNIILSLLICDLPRIIVAAGLSLDLIGHSCWGHCSYRCAFLQEIVLT